VARKEIQAGRVVAVGPGVRFPDGTLIPPQVGVGELVLYTGAWQGEEFSREGRQYRVLENLQIAAALPPDANEITIRHLFQ
jgi:co-chaperonin GroES (HSP10)